MSITLAILIPGLLLLILGLALASGRSTVRAAFQSFPRSPAATVVFFGTGALCFLYRVWNLSPADFGEYRTILTIAFAAIALLAFKYTPDFLAVRGLAILVLLGAMPLLDATYMVYGREERRVHQVRRQRHAGHAHQLHERAGTPGRRGGRRH